MLQAEAIRQPEPIARGMIAPPTIAMTSRLEALPVNGPRRSMLSAKMSGT